MSHVGLLVEPHTKEDALGLSLKPLQEALAVAVPGHEREWTAAVGEALSRVETALRQHRAAARAPDGLLAEVDETRPSLARQADRLRIDHDAFLKDALALEEPLHHHRLGLIAAMDLHEALRAAARATHGPGKRDDASALSHQRVTRR